MFTAAFQITSESHVNQKKNICQPENSVKKPLPQHYNQKPLRPQTTFQNLVCKSAIMQTTIHQARILSLSSSPLLIYGEKGTECEKLAECIHNESPRSNAPFVHINCKSYSAEKQRDLLLGYLSN